MKDKKIVFFTGSGISVASGIPTFRGKVDSIYDDENAMKIMSAEHFKTNPQDLYKFTNEFMVLYGDCKPNSSHYAISDIAKDNDVTVITQNVDSLHELSGTENVLHLHGIKNKCRAIKSVTKQPILYDYPKDGLNYGDTNEFGVKIRPHVVLFGEMPYNVDESIKVLKEADFVVIIGTSFTIQYTLGMMHYANNTKHVFYIDPSPNYDISNIIKRDKVTYIETEDLTTAINNIKTQIELWD